jgi:hypothetical protein
LRHIDIYQYLSVMLNFLISIGKNGLSKKETIHDPESKLKIRVFELFKSQLNPQKGEIRYFVTAGNETLAFETEGYHKHQNSLILQMIAWYCVYLGLLEAQIHSNWPSLN